MKECMYALEVGIFSVILHTEIYVTLQKKKNASEKHQWVVLLEKVSYLTLILPLPSPLYSSGSKEGVSSVNHLYNNIMYIWMEGSEWLVESCKAFKVIFCMYFI